MKTKQTKKRVSYRLDNTVCGMLKMMMIHSGKTATQIVEESIINRYFEKSKNSAKYEKS